MAAAALALTACTQHDDVALEATSSEVVPIAFDCTSPTNAPSTRATNGTTGIITQKNGRLYHTGFGVFVREKDAQHTELMNNQQVKYTFQADYDVSGYWSYSPLKYWPVVYDELQAKSVPAKLAFAAYAPYVDRPESLPASTTGIVALSSKDATDPYLIYKRAHRREDTIDLLWDYRESDTREAVKLNLLHALARVSVAVTLSSKPAGVDRVLVERVTLSGSLAQKGQLALTGYTIDPSTGAMADTTVPSWTVDLGDMMAETIVIDHDPTTYNDPGSDRYSYGVVSEAIRYVKGLPREWQPEGLVAGEAMDVISQEYDQPSYLLLIPQSSLSLHTSVKLHVFYSDGTDTTLTKGTGTTIAVATPLNGNTIYTLNLQLSL